MRFGVAGILLLPVMLAARPRDRPPRLDRAWWRSRWAAARRSPCWSAPGLVYAPVAHASAITQGMVPLTVGVMAAIVLGRS